MTRGAKPKPKALKLIQGTHRKDRDNEHAPDIQELGRIPPPPETLSAIAQDKWRELVPHLVQHKIITGVDIHNLEAFCSAYSLWRLAMDDVATHGVLVESSSGELKKNPAITAVKDASGDMRAFGSNLGLDPASRSRLVVGNKKSQDNEFSNF